MVNVQAALAAPRTTRTLRSVLMTCAVLVILLGRAVSSVAEAHRPAFPLSRAGDELISPLPPTVCRLNSLFPSTSLFSPSSLYKLDQLLTGNGPSLSAHLP
jgi:hypothetical protein